MCCFLERRELSQRLKWHCVILMLDVDVFVYLLHIKSISVSLMLIALKLHRMCTWLVCAS